MAIASFSLRIQRINLALLAIFCLTAGSAFAQESKPDPKKAPPKPLDSEVVELLTKDNVRLMATYYPSREGKEAVPVIILHDSKTDRNAYHTLALTLQSVGHAVIIPDMRGYGESNKVKQFGGQPDIEIDAKRMPIRGYDLMVGVDLDKVRSFLKDENDQGKLNLNQLCIIGVGDLGCALAINWTVRDWTFQEISAVKQSRDVHALVLVSPEPTFKSLAIPKLITPLAKIEGPNKTSAERLSMFFVVGAGKPGNNVKPNEWRDASSYAETFTRFHPKAEDKQDIKDNQTVFFGEMPTTLQGGDLLSPAMLKTPVQIEGFKPIPLQTMILTFIDWRLVDKAKEFPWSSRKLPGG